MEAALQNGSRGMPGGATLPRLLQEHRGVRNRKRLPPLTEEMILGWARAHRAATGSWPNENSGPVEGAPGEVWGNVNQALRQGLRALHGGDTLAKLLARRLGASNSAIGSGRAGAAAGFALTDERAMVCSKTSLGSADGRRPAACSKSRIAESVRGP